MLKTEQDRSASEVVMSTHDKLIPTRRVGRQRVVNRVEELLQLSAGKRVLHLGCVDYPFTELQGERLLHRQLLKVARDLWGLDASTEGVERLRAMGFPNILLGDVEHLEPGLIPAGCDLIIAGELIEHLACPGGFLTSLRTHMDPRTELVLTTPNAFGGKGFLHSLLWREKVHPDHNYYFSYYTITQLLGKFGFRCNAVYYYQEVQGQGLALAVDRCLAVAPRVWPILADGLFVRATVQ